MATVNTAASYHAVACWGIALSVALLLAMMLAPPLDMLTWWGAILTRMPPQCKHVMA